MSKAIYSRLVGAYRKLADLSQTIRTISADCRIDAELQATDAAFDEARRHLQSAVDLAKDDLRTERAPIDCGDAA